MCTDTDTDDPQRINSTDFIFGCNGWNNPSPVNISASSTIVHRPVTSSTDISTEKGMFVSAKYCKFSTHSEACVKQDTM